MKKKNPTLTLIIIAIIVAGLSLPVIGYLGRSYIRNLAVVRAARGEHTVEEMLGTYADLARERLAEHFDKYSVDYPPGQVVLVGLKEEKRLEVYAGAKNGPLKFINSYPIMAASGGPGPKLNEGDRQVPEGFYDISLEPNTPYHLGLRLNYPNSDDWQHAREDGRAAPGSDILIHGNNCSIGCLAMGDPASEDLFVLVADSGESNCRVILVPHDFRVNHDMAPPAGAPPWVEALYKKLAEELAKLPPGQLAGAQAKQAESQRRAWAAAS